MIMSKWFVNIVLPFHVPEYSHRQHMWIEVLKLLRWHGHVRLLMSSKVLERKMSNSSYMRRAARVKRLGARIVFLCEDWLSLSLFLFFLSFSPFFHLSFLSSKLELTPSWNKDTPYGWNLQRDPQQIPPQLYFCVKVKCVISRSPFECVLTPKSIKVYNWCSPPVLGHRTSLAPLNLNLKWLEPRIPEGAYYA